LSSQSPAQTLGGNAVFNFLSQPNTAQLSALGGVNISTIGNDVGMSFHNPALLRDGMHQQVNTSFNSFVAGIRNFSLTTAYHLEEAKPILPLARIILITAPLHKQMHQEIYWAVFVRLIMWCR
jgi:hypothetical protein